MKITGKQRIYIATVLLALLFGFVLAVWLFKSKDQVDITAFTVAVLSGVISLVALFIALQTYISIDSVNSITKMEGNILDNEYYVTSIPEFIETYPQITVPALRDAVLSELKLKLKLHSATAVDFADTMQSMIDVLVLFPAMELNQDSSSAIQSLISQIKAKTADFQAVSRGNSIQIQQAVKLFEAVCEYQRLTANASSQPIDKAIVNNGLLKVRGPVLRNPVSATVYYNYLGLYYRKCAVALLGGNDSGALSLLKAWRGAALNRLSPENVERLQRYLSLSETALERALLLSKEDPMWRGYIIFNQARVRFMNVLLFDQPMDEVEVALSQMSEAIAARSTLNELIRDVIQFSANLSNDKTGMSILQQHYLYQEEYARQLNVNYHLVFEKPALYRGAPVKSSDEYESAVQPFVELLSDSNRKFLAALRTPK